MLPVPNKTGTSPAGAGIVSLWLRVLHVAPPARAARLHVRPHGPRARGGHHENGETGSQSREILPTHWRRMLLSARLQPNAVLLVH